MSFAIVHKSDPGDTWLAGDNNEFATFSATAQAIDDLCEAGRASPVDGRPQFGEPDEWYVVEASDA